jgi:hypothetical protein
MGGLRGGPADFAGRRWGGVESHAQDHRWGLTLGLGTLRPLYADGSVINEATALHKELALPPMPSIRAE